MKIEISVCISYPLMVLYRKFISKLNLDLGLRSFLILEYGIIKSVFSVETVNGLLLLNKKLKMNIHV